jgi:hypothetical protein
MKSKIKNNHILPILIFIILIILLGIFIIKITNKDKYSYPPTYFPTSTISPTSTIYPNNTYLPDWIIEQNKAHQDTPIEFENKPFEFPANIIVPPIKPPIEVDIEQITVPLDDIIYPKIKGLNSKNKLRYVFSKDYYWKRRTDGTFNRITIKFIQEPPVKKPIKNEFYRAYNQVTGLGIDKDMYTLILKDNKFTSDKIQIDPLQEIFDSQWESRTFDIRNAIQRIVEDLLQPLIESRSVLSKNC